MKEKLLLIAEKPSLMRELKAVYDTHKNQINYNIDFTALAGHICAYAKPSEYTEWNKKWTELQPYLPMIPDKWKINIIDDKKKMYSDIKKKIEEGHYDGLICATDADREGNLIFYLLEQKLNKKMKCYRFWVNDLTEKAILKSYGSMVDLHKDTFQQNLTYASILRSRFDWLIGMNISISASLKSGMTMKIGRVKTPTLKIVYDNSKAIDEFVPKTTYGVTCKYKEGFTGILVDNKTEKSFETKKEAEDIISQLKKVATITSIEKKTVKTIAPPLFKLSDLQVYANKVKGYSADKTLELVQSLYEKKIVTYPRTDCRVLSSESVNDFSQMMKTLSIFPELSQYVSKISQKDFDNVAKNKKYVDNDEVNKSSHTALVPTGASATNLNLTTDETEILKMICIRFLSIFLPPLVEEKTALLTDNNGYTFRSNGKMIIDKGYTVLLNKNLEDNILPTNLKEKDILNVTELIPNEKTSVPPTRLTQGELIAIMENINKLIDDKELKEIMKEANGIGTPATRASIITALIKDGYIDVKKSKKSEQLFISEKGKQYIENIKDFDITSPELTAEWEGKLKKVEHGNMNSKEFSDKMKEFLNETIQQINQTRMNQVVNNRASVQTTVVGKCPRCGCDVIETSKGFSCSGWKNDPPCKFSIWKSNKLLAASKKKLTAAKVKKLLEKGYYEENNLVSKTGKKYNTKIVLEDTGEYVNLKLDFNNS